MNKYLTKSKIFVVILISFLVGVFLAPLFRYDLTTIITCIFILAVLFVILFREKVLAILAICGITLFLGVIYFHWYNLRITPINLPLEQETSIVGIVDTEPDIRADQIKLTIKVQNGEMQGQKVLVTVARYPQYQYGDKLKVIGKLEKPGKFEDFDYGQYLSRYEIFSVITHPTTVECISKNDGNKLYSGLLNIKSKFKTAIENSLPEPAVSLAEGLVVGAKGNFSEDLKNQMVQTGTTHIVVISGQNMEIIARFFVEITKYISPYATFITGTLGLGLFTIISGATPSVVRAAVLASLFLFARLVGRRKQIFIPLILTGFVMVLTNPLILRYDIGFQLSFAAMFGLIFISPIIDIIIKHWPLFLREAISSTIGAQITTLPIILFNFGRLSIVAPVTNILILATVPYAMLVSFLVGFAGLVALSLGKLVGLVSWPILEYIILVINYFSKIPYSSIAVNFHSWQWVLVYYFIIILLIIFWQRKKAHP